MAFFITHHPLLLAKVLRKTLRNKNRTRHINACFLHGRRSYFILKHLSRTLKKEHNPLIKKDKK